MSVIRRVSTAKNAWTAIIFVFAFAVSCAQGQVAGGAIGGIVHDPTNALVTRAIVTVQNQDTGIAHQTETNASGLFTVPNLPPAIYSIKVSALGFRDSLINGIIVAVGDQKTLTFKLSLESSTQTIDVAASASQVELVTAGVLQRVDQDTLEQLPLNGRDWTQLASLQPGVNIVRNQASVGSNGSSDATKVTRGFGTQLSISGTRSAQNNYRQDGISFNDYTNDAPGNVLGAQLGVDAIQEFSVLTTNYSAEYGKTSGGVVNAVTRSGTNAFHGSVYEFLRNSALDARNFFEDPTLPKAPFKRNQF